MAYSLKGVISSTLTVLAWYALNITVIMTNRHLQTTGGLRAPVSLTLVHMIGCTIFSNSAVYLCGTHFTPQPLISRRQLVKVLVLTVTFALSIVCGVAALGYIPVSFKEMIAATTPLFTAVLAFALTGERENLARSTALVLVAVGAIIATEGEPMWNLLGFLLGMGATVTRGLKSVLQHILLSNEEEKLDSMNLLRYMSIFAVAFLIPSVLVLEGPMVFIDTVLFEYDAGNTMFIVWLVLNVISAFLLNLFQFLVTKCVGPTTLQVLGNFKGVLCAFLSVMVFRNPVTVQSVGGYMLTTVGVFVYSYLKNAETMKAARKKQDASPLKTPQKPQYDVASIPLMYTKV